MGNMHPNIRVKRIEKFMQFKIPINTKKNIINKKPQAITDLSKSQ